MKKTVVRVVCAIGQAGQLGLKGGLPWEGDRSPEFVADVARFFDVTRGHVLLAGPKTIASVPDFARADRELVVVRSSMDPEDTLRRFAGCVVFIGGGPPVWDAYVALQLTRVFFNLCGSQTVSGDRAMSGHANENDMVTRFRDKSSWRGAHR